MEVCLASLLVQAFFGTLRCHRALQRLKGPTAHPWSPLTATRHCLHHRAANGQALCSGSASVLLRLFHGRALCAGPPPPLAHTTAATARRRDPLRVAPPLLLLPARPVLPAAWPDAQRDARWRTYRGQRRAAATERVARPDFLTEKAREGSTLMRRREPGSSAARGGTPC